MRFATEGVKFSFDGIMYVQTDGGRYGQSFGSGACQHFIGHYKQVLFEKINMPLVYKRYVDDTFSVFECSGDADNFLAGLNSLHPSLRFTMEMEKEESLPFLDVLVQRRDGVFDTSIFRKPTGLYTSWNSFVPKSRKTGLIETLVHHTLMICSPNLLDCELEKLHSIFVNNGYPSNIIKRVIARKVRRFKEPAVLGPSRCPIYLKLPWLGRNGKLIADKVSSCISSCYFAVKLRTIFKTRNVCPSFMKDRLFYLSKNSVIYQFKCRCDLVYIGRTGLRLETRISQHVPSHIRNPEHRNRVSQSRSRLLANV